MLEINFYSPSKVLLAAVSGILLMFAGRIFAQPASGSATAAEIRIFELQGSAQILRANTKEWRPAQTNQVLQAFDRLRTGAHTRLLLRWTDQSTVSFGGSTELEILPPHSSDAQSGLHLIRG